MMLARFLFSVSICATTVCGQDVKTKSYTSPEGCFKTYHLVMGSVLTSKGLIEDPTVNAIMKDAVSIQMAGMKIAEADKNADIEIHFMSGNSAGLHIDDPAMGKVMMWNIGGSQPTSGRTYKKSSLVIVVTDNRSKQTVWAARCIDKFGDPGKMRERIEKAVAKAFAKFPKGVACS